MPIGRDCLSSLEKVIIVGAVLFLLTMCNLLRTACSDPGIIPRATESEAENMERKIKDEEMRSGKINKPRMKLGKNHY